MIFSNLRSIEGAGRASRAAKATAFFLLLVVAISACGSSDEQQGNARAAGSASNSPGLEEPSEDALPEVSTSTTSTTVPVTTTTEPPLLRTVQISPSGRDSSFGGPGEPVATVARALSRLAPGGTIEFEPGVYAPLTLSGVNGLPDLPIRLVGQPGVEFRGFGHSSDAGILIEDSSNIEIVGMTVRTVLWGIYVANSDNIEIVNNDVADIGQEAIRIKDGSSNVTISDNRIADTGQRTDNGIPNGEGIYIGTGTPSGEDFVTDVLISNNTITGIADEAIDIKTPATNVTVVDNTISDVVTHTTGAIVVHLNNESDADPNITIERNVVRDVSRASQFNDGNCIVTEATVRIVNNVLHNCQHRGIFLRGETGLATILHNTFVNSGSFGAIIDEGLGIDLISENNLGVAGAANARATASDFVSVATSDYRFEAPFTNAFTTTPATGVSDDLTGATRSTSGTVTFGALEGN